MIPSADGPTNMARDLELLEAAEGGRPGARLYRWDGLWVTLGRFQTPEEALIGKAPFVIRPTGGLAVVHGRDLTVAIALPFENPRTRSVKDAYRAMVRPILVALSACGVEAILAEDRGSKAFRSEDQTRTPLISDCFAIASDFDVIEATTGSKVCGCALRVTRKAALLQASIPYAQPIIDVEKIVRGATASPILPWHYMDFSREFAKQLRLEGIDERVG